MYRVMDDQKKHIEEDEQALEVHLIEFDKLKFQCNANFSVMVKSEVLDNQLKQIRMEMNDMKK